MSSLFGKAPLVERYRPATWSEVAGQDKTVSRIRQLAKRNALAGRAYWISGQSGTGKTTIARLLAAEVADDFSTQEVDASALTVVALRELERESQISGWGEKAGRAFLVNEAHGLRKDVIRQFLVLLERIPPTSPGFSQRRRRGSKGCSRTTTTRGRCRRAACRCPWRGATWPKRSRSAPRRS